MPYCPNCGDEVGKTHRYCGSCGQPLSPKVDEAEDGMPPSGTASGRIGFLSGRSMAYLSDVVSGEQELDRDSVEYIHLAEDVGNGLADFFYVTAVDDLNLFMLLIEAVGDCDLVLEDSDDLTARQQRRQAMVYGFLQLPRFYDQSLGTSCEDEVGEALTDVIEKAKEAVEKNDSGSESTEV